jgi:hypothetical protein
MALQPCAECGREISSAAPTCPQCGAPQPIQSNKPIPKGYAAFAIVVGTVLLAVVFSRPDSGSYNGQGAQVIVASDSPGGLVASLIAKREQCRQNLAQMQALGVKVRDSDNRTAIVEYDERIWGAFEHDDKIRQALLVYCAKMPDSGSYSVMIEGLHNGKLMASVTDGNYFDD